jgi:leucyl aminopeptidase
MALRVELIQAANLPSDVQVVGVPVIKGADGLELVGDLSAFGALVQIDPQGTDRWRRQGFSAKVGQTLALLSNGEGPTIVLIGLGSAEGMDADRWRRAAAGFVRAAGEGGTGVFLFAPTEETDPSRALGAVMEGALLGSYRFDDFRSNPQSKFIETLLVVAHADGEEWALLQDAAARGERIGWAVRGARDLINTPPSDLTPWVMAERISHDLQNKPGLRVEVWGPERIQEERFGGLLGVSRGSGEPPRFLRADYDPPGHQGSPPHIVLVGKGITFDSGGLSLKTPEGMTTMKTDMSGAAIVMSVISACADLGVDVRITALAPITENMPGEHAIKPGDVLTIRNGSTIEVLNTDAEGRLVLADALSFATELGPDRIVDVATLTGAITMALGTSIAGLFGNDDRWNEQVRASGARVGEKLWPMPLPDEYADHIDSDVADMKNVGKAGQAGAIAAALLLERFVGEVPWVHLDIAGTGRSAESSGYLSKGATAFSVRTLIELLSTYTRGE